MNRREALGATVALLGGTVIGANTFLSGCRNKNEPVTSFSDEVILLLDEIAETILPETASSPGAKAARVGSFMKTIVSDCYSPDEQKIFFQGIDSFRNSVKQKYAALFEELSMEKKLEWLTALDKEASDYRLMKKEDQPAHYYTMIKELTIWGYFSSEPGATRAFRYVPAPGRYEGCVSYTSGEGAWVY